jgi:phospholipase C
MDHVVVVIFENRSFDNLLGHLYEPGESAAFEGVIGKDLSNPIPVWAEHEADRAPVPYTVADDMDSPNPDSGEEYPHTNTQLFNTLDDHNRCKMAGELAAPWNAPAPDQVPTMDGFVTDYISFFTAMEGRQPTYDEYSKIMTGYTSEQVPVLNGLARGFGVFDHWFSEVPSQTFPNRSFWTAGTSSGFVKNAPTSNFLQHNDAPTIFERLEAHGRTWKVYVLEPDGLSFTGLIHAARLRDRFATHFVPFSEFLDDAANGTLPDFSLIEPSLISGHTDYHPAAGMAMLPGVEAPVDPPSSILAGEAFLARIYDALRAASSGTGSNHLNTTLLVGWDEPGGTFDHVAPPRVPSPDPGSPAGQCGFRYERSGYRVPAVVVSPWVPEQSVFTEEYRHTSLLATLREVWSLGDPFTRRDAAARTFTSVFTLSTPRAPESWPVITPRPVPGYHFDAAAFGPAFSSLGKAVVQGCLAFAAAEGIQLGSAPADPSAPMTPEEGIAVIHELEAHIFPKLAPTGS